MSKSTSIKLELIALLTCLMALVGLSMDIMLPAFGDIAQDLKLENAHLTQYIVIAFIFGMVFGELVFGPLADAIGRKKIILIGLAIYSFGALIALKSSSFEILILGRVIQGIGVSGPKIGTRALIRDLYEGAAMARLMSVIFGVLIAVPMVAPLLGQIIVQASGWRYLFVGFLVASMCLAIWLGQRQQETLTVEKRIPLAINSLTVNAALILKNRHGMAYMLCAGLIFGAQLCYLALSHAIFVELYQIGDQFPLYFALVAMGAGVGFFANAKLVEYLGMEKIVNIALLSIFLLSLVFFAMSWFSNGVPSFNMFMLFCCLVFFAFGVVFGNVNALGMKYMARVAGLASSLFASTSSLLAVFISGFFGSFYNGSTLPLALVFMCAAGVAYILVIWAQKTVSKPV